MKLFLDCEFNGFGGELISMAIVDENNHFFYEVLEIQNINTWVSLNVMPVLNKLPISKEYFKNKLQNYLTEYDSIEIIADWPDDFKYFFQSITLDNGYKLKTPKIIAVLDESLNAKSSTVPHNALHDAIAIKNMYMENVCH